MNKSFLKYFGSVALIATLGLNSCVKPQVRPNPPVQEEQKQLKENIQDLFTLKVTHDEGCVVNESLSAKLVKLAGYVLKDEFKISEHGNYAQVWIEHNNKSYNITVVDVNEMDVAGQGERDTISILVGVSLGNNLEKYTEVSDEGLDGNGNYGEEYTVNTKSLGGRCGVLSEDERRVREAKGKELLPTLESEIEALLEFYETK